MALVMVVIDEPETLLQLLLSLESGGHQTVLAADADTALERMAARPVEVVVLDVAMPVKDGWAVLDAIQAQPHPPAVVIVSARAGPVDLERASRRGATRSLAPPVTAADLNRMIALALSSRPPG